MLGKLALLTARVSSAVTEGLHFSHRLRRCAFSHNLQLLQVNKTGAHLVQKLGRSCGLDVDIATGPFLKASCEVLLGGHAPKSVGQCREESSQRADGFE
jgi:hypothetical protein